MLCSSVMFTLSLPAAIATSGLAPVACCVPGVEIMYKPPASGILAMTLASGRGVRMYMVRSEGSIWMGNPARLMCDRDMRV